MCTVAAPGSTTTSRERTNPRRSPSTHSRRGGSNVQVTARAAADRDRRVRHVRTGREPPPRLPAIANRHPGVDLDHVEQPVSRVGSRGGVPPAESIDVEGGGDRPVPPAAAASDDVGDGDVLAHVGRHPQQVDVEAGDLRPGRRPAEAGQQVATGQAHPVAVRPDAASASEATSTSPSGGSTSSPHGSPRRITPRPGRSRRRRRRRGRRARRPRRPAGGSPRQVRPTPPAGPGR